MPSQSDRLPRAREDSGRVSGLMRGHLLRRLAVTSLIVIMCWGSALAQEINDLSTSVPQTKVEKKIDLYLSGHIMGLLPQDKDLSVGGSRIPHTDVRGTIGAGIKFDAYPWFTKKILGAEIEAFGLGGSVRAPRTTSGTGTTQAQGSLIAVNTRYNVILRYPGETIQPYIGVRGRHVDRHPL